MSISFEMDHFISKTVEETSLCLSSHISFCLL